MAAPYSLSRFAYTIERMGIIAVFHTLHPEAIFIRKDTWAHVLAGQSPADLKEILQSRNLLVSVGEDEKALLQSRHKATVRLSRPTILYLMLAQGCNNACTYCPIPELAKRYGSNLLKFSDAVAGLEMWKRHIQEYVDSDPYYLILYGGEPLLNRPVLENILERVRKEKESGELPRTVEIILPTNGLLVDAALASMLREHNVLVSLGIDGPPKYHDATRQTPDGLPTSVEVLRAATMLREAGVRLSASVTLTPASVRNSDVLRDYLRILGIVSFGFNVLKGSALSESLGTMTQTEYYESAARAVLDGFASDLQEFQLQKKINSLVTGESFGLDCTCYGNQIVVQADGEVTNCPFLRYELGQVSQLPENFRITESEPVRLWRTRLPVFENKNATTLLDGGGCAWGATELSHLPWEPDSGNATYNREIVHELLWRLLPEKSRDELVSGQLTCWDYRRDRNHSTS